MQTIEIKISDADVNELCAASAKEILAEAGSSERMPDREMAELIFAAAQIAQRNFERVGTVGRWCFFCGVDELIKLCLCHCKFPADFRCHGRLVCESCRQSHRTLTDHISKMVSFPVVERADSRRAAFEMQLYRAAKRACNPSDADTYDHAEKRDLAYHLAQADPFGDSETFRIGVLRAFRVSKFMAYQALATELEAQKQEAIIRAVRRSIRIGNRKIAREKLAAHILDSYAKDLRVKSAAKPKREESGAEFYR